MSNSVNTNVGAMIALQNLNATNSDLAQTQNRVNTGLKVASAKDNGAIWAIAQAQRSDIACLGAVKDSLDRGSSALDVAISAGESISDLLTQMKEKALAASDKSLDSTSRTALNEDFKALRDQIQKIVDNAEFNGVNLLKTGSAKLEVLANAKGTSVLTIQPETLALGGAVLTASFSASLAFTTATQAAGVVTLAQTALTNVSASMTRLGTKSKAVGLHSTFIGKLSDSIEAGVGNLVDADLAKESAKLTALQTKQQLGVQALSIANKSPSILTQLFQQ